MRVLVVIYQSGFCSAPTFSLLLSFHIVSPSLCCSDKCDEPECVWASPLCFSDRCDAPEYLWLHPRGGETGVQTSAPLVHVSPSPDHHVPAASCRPRLCCIQHHRWAATTNKHTVSVGLTSLTNFSQSHKLKAFESSAPWTASISFWNTLELYWAIPDPDRGNVSSGDGSLIRSGVTTGWGWTKYNLTCLYVHCLFPFLLNFCVYINWSCS